MSQSHVVVAIARLCRVARPVHTPLREAVDRARRVEASPTELITLCEDAEARIRSLAKYHQARGSLPTDWKYTRQGARLVGPEQYAEYKGWWVDSGKPIGPEEWGLSRAIRHGETSRGELIRIQSFDGSFKTIINSGAPLRDSTGRIPSARRTLRTSAATSRRVPRRWVHCWRWRRA